MLNIIKKSGFWGIVLLILIMPSSIKLSATTTPSKYVVVNSVNWDLNALKALPFQYGSEFTYFVLTVSTKGTLSGESLSVESEFVKNVHDAGKKATFTVGGAKQSTSNMNRAITKKTILIDSIASHIISFGFDGVVLDIENTNINPQVMADFLVALRARLNAIKPNLIIGVYVQPYQINTVWANLSSVSNHITWVAPMLYDFGTYNHTQWTNLTNAWLPRVSGDKSKLLTGLAVNYPANNGGLSTSQFSEMINAQISQGWAGMTIWNNILYIPSYTQVVGTKIQVQ